MIKVLIDEIKEMKEKSKKEIEKMNKLNEEKDNKIILLENKYNDLKEKINIL